MKILYFECNMGAAGDMLMASLLELSDDPDICINKLNNLGIPNVKISMKKTKKCGITGSHVNVLVDGVDEADYIEALTDGHLGHDVWHRHEHSHGRKNKVEKECLDSSKKHQHSYLSINDIEKFIDGLEMSDKIKKDAKSVYRLIAEAESKVHGGEISEIHFHEIGTMDAVADVVGVCMLINELAPDRIVTSPICVGSGHIHCSHGILPVPAPATELILHGVPIYSGNINGELCTPTGAALLKYFTDEFSKMPQMIVEKTGYGMGKKDFEAANCVRSMLGTTNDMTHDVVELCCNLDDMTAEAVGYAMEKLLDEGALDVYTIPIGMKKNRPGTMLTCMCKDKDKEKFLQIIFKHTTTLGIREYECRRYCLSRRIIEKETEYGKIHLKKASGYGVNRTKPEYEDLKAIADKNNMSLSQVIAKLD